MKRVSKRKTIQKRSRNKRFSVDVLVNEALQKGKWRDFYTEGSTIGELLEITVETYDLEEFVAERLEMSYISHTGGGASKRVLLKAADLIEGTRRIEADGAEVPLLLRNLELHVGMQQGDVVDQDVTCDSQFMLDVIPSIGAAMRAKYRWLPATDKLYLVMDNAGGHGTNDAKKEYTRILGNYNIEIIWQVPRSPETNMLDLGVWMSIQSAVMRTHRMKRCQHDALAKSVMVAWEKYLNIRAFTHVHGRLRVALVCICEDAGGNTMIEAKRGKLYRDATIIDLTREEEEQAEQPAAADVQIEAQIPRRLVQIDDSDDSI